MQNLDTLLADPPGTAHMAAAAKAWLPPDVSARLDVILGLPSYREATLTLLAWSLASPTP